MATARTPSDRPLVVVVSGPNGAGKSTTAPELLSQALHVQEFVNADAIALGLSGLHPETVAFAAGRVMLSRVKDLARRGVDFAFETTLASRSFAPWLRRLRESGYRSHLVFLSLPTVELALERVAERVRLGGHDVPPAVVRRRFIGGLRNFFFLYRQQVDSWQLLDNSNMGAPFLIASRLPGRSARVEDQAAWTNLLEKAQ